MRVRRVKFSGGAYGMIEMSQLQAKPGEDAWRFCVVRLGDGYHFASNPRIAYALPNCFTRSIIYGLRAVR